MYYGFFFAIAILSWWFSDGVEVVDLPSGVGVEVMDLPSGVGVDLPSGVGVLVSGTSSDKHVQRGPSTTAGKHVRQDDLLLSLSAILPWG